MLDLSRFADLFGDFFGGAATSMLPAEMIDQVRALGLDPAALASMEPGQIVSMLAENGVDLSQLDVTQVEALAQQLGLDAGFGEVLASFAGLETPER